jgi:anhydro-N-acetylmuramic acid kinase
MVYRVIGLMSGSSLDGLDIAYVELEESGGKWTFTIPAAACRPYPEEWLQRLGGASRLHALDYQLLHADYGHWLGKETVQFMEEIGLQYKVGLISSHGHTSFHVPGRMTAQLGDGASIAAETGLPVVCDLRAADVALGGQGAPIVPMGEKLLWPTYSNFLNIGGIANITGHLSGRYIAFDVCPANRVLNMLAGLKGMAYDDDGKLAASGMVNAALLDRLNGLDYYGKEYPKSLANEFGTDTVYPMIRDAGLSVEDSLATMVAHIARQVGLAVIRMRKVKDNSIESGGRMLVTGGGAFHSTLVGRIRHELSSLSMEVEVAEPLIVNYKEAVVMALLGVLRWREEETVLSSVTGAIRGSIGGALWMGSH